MPLDKQHLDLVLQSLEVDLGLVPSPALHRKSRQKLLFPGVFDESGRKKELRYDRNKKERARKRMATLFYVFFEDRKK